MCRAKADLPCRIRERRRATGATYGIISGVKVSVSLPVDDVEFLDTYAQERGLESRSAAVHEAIKLLRASELDAAYEAAWAEWKASDDADLCDSVVR